MIRTAILALSLGILTSCVCVPKKVADTCTSDRELNRYKSNRKIPATPDPHKSFDVEEISIIPLWIGVVDEDWNLLEGYDVRFATTGHWLTDFKDIDGGLKKFQLGEIEQEFMIYLLGRGASDATPHAKFPVQHVKILDKLQQGQRPVIFRFIDSKLE